MKIYPENCNPLVNGHRLQDDCMLELADKDFKAAQLH